jgi:hypothetical protein
MMLDLVSEFEIWLLLMSSKFKDCMSFASSIASIAMAFIVGRFIAAPIKNCPTLLRSFSP